MDDITLLPIMAEKRHGRKAGKTTVNQIKPFTTDEILQSIGNDSVSFGGNTLKKSGRGLTGLFNKISNNKGKIFALGMMLLSALSFNSGLKTESTTLGGNADNFCRMNEVKQRFKDITGKDMVKVAPKFSREMLAVCNSVDRNDFTGTREHLANALSEGLDIDVTNENVAEAERFKNINYILKGATIGSNFQVLTDEQINKAIAKLAEGYEKPVEVHPYVYDSVKDQLVRNIYRNNI